MPAPAKERTFQRSRQPPQPSAPLRIGEWLWTTRAGAEPDLLEELALATPKIPARRLGPALVASAKPASGLEPAFARQGLPVQALCPPEPGPVLAALRPLLKRAFALQVFVPDSDEGNRRGARAGKLQEEVLAALRPLQSRAEDVLDGGPAAREAGGLLAQVCLFSDEQAAVGVLRALDAHSLAPGGRLRTHADPKAPARSALKLQEAFLWLGRGPEPGEVCVDLGAAPGGWTYVLHKRRAHVVAIDPGKLAPALRGQRGIEHLPMDAFRFEPEVAADWLFCDMAFRPLEVASLLAKWGRRHWARFLLANLKLPMRKRAELLSRIKEILATGGWTGLRARQLYHDRDEVTIFAWRGFGIDARPPRPRQKDKEKTKR